jgi:hypothetical protein
MADMPGESQEEPSVMVVAMLAAIRLTSFVQMSFSTSQVAREATAARNAAPHPRRQLPIRSFC